MAPVLLNPKHTVDGSGNFILSWMWEMQVDDVRKEQRMGWTYWAIYKDMPDAVEWLETYVKPRFPNQFFQIKEYKGREDYFTKL